MCLIGRLTHDLPDIYSREREVWGGFSKTEEWREQCHVSSLTLVCAASFLICRESESESESEVAQSCLTLCDPIDSSPPGSSVPGIL